MAEKIVSPGVFTNEIDESFLPAALGDIGAAVVGPTVKGPALVPTVVNSYAEFEQVFGTSFRSGSTGGSYLQYLTSLTAEQYLKHQGTLTVVRILDGNYSHASAVVPTGSAPLAASSENNPQNFSASHVGGSTPYGAANTVSFKLHTLSHGSLLNSVSESNSAGGYGFQSTASADVGTNMILTSGSKHNLRWEVSTQNKNKGTFTLLIRAGNDTSKRKQILESWNNLSLDPNQPNFISKVIGDSSLTIRGSATQPYLQPSGSFKNNSKYVRVEVFKNTVDYLDENGNIRVGAASGSLPGIASGAFDGGSNGYAGFDAVGGFEGTGNQDKCIFFEKATDSNVECYHADNTTTADGGEAYAKALRLLKNQDEYDINMILLPGLNQQYHSGVVAEAIDTCESRGDCFVIVDPVPYNSSLTAATGEAADYDSNYAAMYWPWVQIPDNQVGVPRWVPPSVVMAGVYAFNDKIAQPWFAPAGLNRGGIDTAIQAERKLTHGDRDDLYDANVNPIATFPGQGVTVWGQKTLQKKASALDRVNVRRLLIKVKKFIAASSRFLVFEQNTGQTRNKFLNIVQPYLEQIQSQSGLNAFRVVMDETNNTPDVVDRNILYGQIFLQPTRTAEYIILDFTVQPTGATFPE